MAPTEEIRHTILSTCKPEHPEDGKISVNQNARGQQSAVVTMVTKDAESLLSLQTLRVGFSDCHIQERISVERCYKCRDFGHSARAAPDKKPICQTDAINVVSQGTTKLNVTARSNSALRVSGKGINRARVSADSSGQL